VILKFEYVLTLAKTVRTKFLLQFFRLMGTIVHTAEDEFVVHVFHCEPSAGALCKVIEAACKVGASRCQQVPAGALCKLIYTCMAGAGALS